YLALKQIDGITFKKLETWGDDFKLKYTPNGDDAVLIDYNAQRDFAFQNDVGYLHIEMWASRSYLYCTIAVTPYSYGVQTGDRVGYASIVLSGTNTLKNNVKLAANAVDGSTLYYYNEFSFNQIVGPRTAQNGYGDTKNGRGVVVKGGGVAQVASVIYLAVKDISSVKITEKRTYAERYNQNYVDSADDAIVTDYSNGQDFRFRYMGYATLVINTYVSTDGTRLICEVYERY
ncbi:MAG: VanW family protein, partial [Clostridia bacterium]|nr:VanW family protein [Clostridia bacterium]